MEHVLDLTLPRPHSELPEANLISLHELVSRTPQGFFLELGVYKGGSAWVLYQLALARKCELHLFDSFKGIEVKDEIDLIGVGRFSDVDLTQVKEFLPEAVFHVGTFPNTLTDEIQNIAFMHIDCDQYVTCKKALELLWPRVVSGGIVAFDDYPFPGIKKAIHDYFINDTLLFSSAGIPYVVKKGGLNETGT